MDPITMAIIGMQVAGSATQLYGQRKARKAEIKAYEQEAAFLDEQANYTEEVGRKKERAILKEASQLYGDQVNSFSRNNVTLSGSALTELVDTQQAFAEDISNLRDDVAFDVMIARNRSAAQREAASGLRKVGLIQDITTSLVGATQVASTLNQSRGRLSTGGGNNETLLSGNSSSYSKNTRGMTA